MSPFQLALILSASTSVYFIIGWCTLVLIKRQHHRDETPLICMLSLFLWPIVWLFVLVMVVYLYAEERAVATAVQLDRKPTPQPPKPSK